MVTSITKLIGLAALLGFQQATAKEPLVQPFVEQSRYHRSFSIQEEAGGTTSLTWYDSKGNVHCWEKTNSLYDIAEAFGLEIGSGAIPLPTDESAMIGAPSNPTLSEASKSVERAINDGGFGFGSVYASQTTSHVLKNLAHDRNISLSASSDHQTHERRGNFRRPNSGAIGAILQRQIYYSPSFIRFKPDSGYCLPRIGPCPQRNGR